MPTYGYKCPVCDVGFEVSQSAATTAPLPACPECGAAAVRVFAFSARGQGFRHHPV